MAQAAAEEAAAAQQATEQQAAGGQQQSTISVPGSESAALAAQDAPRPKPRLEIYRDPSHRGFKALYFNEFRKLMLIPIIILLIALVQIGIQTAGTGDFLIKGVSLKGGATITILDTTVTKTSLENELRAAFPHVDVDVRSITVSGGSTGLIIDVTASEDEIGLIHGLLEEKTGISKDLFSTELIGSSLGASFFRETFTALILAFLFMAIVVAVFFRSTVPTLGVVLAALADIIVTVAVANIIGIRFSTAGIAALLMLIGYSVDSDILLTTHVIRRKEGTIDQRIGRAFRTAIMMFSTTFIAVGVGLLVSESEVLRQIMTIVLIGICVDIIFTWLLNTAILKLYLSRKHSVV